jgi:hypothetical protein
MRGAWLDVDSAGQVGNVDILMRLNNGLRPVTQRQKVEPLSAHEQALSRTNTFIEFTGPRRVRAAQEKWMVGKSLGPTELEIETECSLISSGTELKVPDWRIRSPVCSPSEFCWS